MLGGQEKANSRASQENWLEEKAVYWLCDRFASADGGAESSLQ